MSIRRTLVLTLLTLLSLMNALAMLWSYQSSDHELEEVFDAELAQMARLFSGISDAALSDVQTRPAKPAEAPAEPLGHRYEKKLAVQIWRADGALLPITANPLPLSPPTQEGYAAVEAGGFRWRTFTLYDPDHQRWIRTAHHQDIRDELSTYLAASNIAPLLLALPLTLGLVWLTVWWAFRPLARLERPLQHMAPEALQPLDAQLAPREVRGLVQAVNALLLRLRDAFEHEKQFTANAAHELRTPLTALRLNLEHEQTRQPERFTPLIHAVDRLVHVVEQMLVMSRLDPAIPLTLSPCRLDHLAADVLAELSPLALQKPIEPVLEAPASLRLIQANPHLIMILLRNLISNAIQYSPAHTSVTVHLHQDDEHLLLQVLDEGPGIPAEARARAQERFVRLDQRQGAGAGLGLSIVKRIVELHRASLHLEDRTDGRPGLCVCIRFPGGATEHSGAAEHRPE